MLRSFQIVLFSFFSYASFASEKSITREEYINSWKDEAIYQMALHKIPASITLAQGILESGDGNSRLAREGKNHFGIKCHSDWTGGKIYEDDETKGECFRKYSNARESYEDHSQFLLRKRYESLFKYEPDDYKAWAKGLKECGYATNPKYPQLLIGIIEEFHLHEFDKLGKEYIRKNRLPDRSKNEDTAPNISVEDKPAKQSGKKPHSSKSSSEERTSITLSSNREVLFSENDLKYVIVKEGDTPESIAADADIGVWLIRKFNDLGESETLQKGDIIYLQPKRGRGTQDHCTVKKGDNLRDISQKYGVRMKKLRKLNALGPNQEPEIGRKLKLRR